MTFKARVKIILALSDLLVKLEKNEKKKKKKKNSANSKIEKTQNAENVINNLCNFHFILNSMQPRVAQFPSINYASLAHKKRTFFREN